MKLLLIISALATLAVARSAEWKQIKSPMEHPRYQEILSKIYSTQNPNEVSREGRIVGGSLATAGQFPYQVYLYLDDMYLCGGSIISSTFVLTAAHCLWLITRAEVYVGSIDRNLQAAWEVAVTGSSNLIIHQSYDDDLLINDIALIRTPVIPLNGMTIGTVELPSRTDHGVLLDGKSAIVSGFGRFSDSLASTSANLLYVQAPILSNAICGITFGSANVRATNVCITTTGGRGSCNGDSGGPLTTELNDRRILIGVVSFGAAVGCQLGHPAVFTRVGSYLDWINQNTGITIKN